MLGQLDSEGEPEFIPGLPRMLCKSTQNQPRVGEKSDQCCRRQRLMEKEHGGTFWPDGNVLYLDRGLGYRGVSICQS